MEHLYYINTWSSEKHNYFLTSYRLDQTLLPCFIESSLRGIQISSENLQQALKNMVPIVDRHLKATGLTEDMCKSSQQFSAFIRNTNHPISKLIDLWPRTTKSTANDPILARSKKTLSAWYTKYTANPLFQEKAILEWFSSFFDLSTAMGMVKFLKLIKKHSHEGKIYPLWNLMGAATGRITASEPALHSTPRDPLARNIIIPSNPKNDFVIADYKTIEVVIQAIKAKEPTMLKVFQNKQDLHTFLAAKARNTIYEDLMGLKKTDPSAYKELRNAMKGMNFGLIYGMGVPSLWENLLLQGQAISFEDTKHLHSTWKKTFPLVHEYQQRCQNYFDNSTAPLYTLGGSHYITSMRGRLRRPDFKQDGKRYLKFTQLINFPIQAGCTDFLKGSLRILHYLKKNGLLAADLVLCAHDEIILECDPSQTNQVAEILSTVMVSVAQKIIEPYFADAPINVDIGIGKSWADKP